MVKTFDCDFGASISTQFHALPRVEKNRYVEVEGKHGNVAMIEVARLKTRKDYG